MQARKLNRLWLTCAVLACISGTPINAAQQDVSAHPLAPPSHLTELPKNTPLDPKIRNVPATTGRANLPPIPLPFATTSLGTFNSPFAIAVLPANGGILVTEKAGLLKLRRSDGTVATIIGTPRVKPGGQGGLLDVAIAPDYVSSRTVYLSYAEPSDGGSQLSLARAMLDVQGAALRNLFVIWRSGSSGIGGQFGAKILFAPDGKTLFLSTGERQRFTPAQDPKQALGKILHLTLDGRAAPGNPIPGGSTVEAMTWSSGHRNPYGLAFAPDGRLWEEEMGPKGGDEVNLILPGRNYGWPIVSNGDNYSGQPIPRHPSRPDLEAPKLWWNPAVSPSGMIYYSGSQFSGFKGSLLICTMSNPGLAQVAVNGDTARAVAFFHSDKRLRDIAQGPGGEIYLIEDGEGARLLRLEPKRP